jgi:hypothetical protein
VSIVVIYPAFDELADFRVWTRREARPRVSSPEEAEDMAAILDLPSGPWEVLPGITTAADLEGLIASGRRFNEEVCKHGSDEKTRGATRKKARQGLATPGYFPGCGE